MRKSLNYQEVDQAADIPQILNIFFPGKCNLQCRYCFVHKQKEDFNEIDEHAIKSAVDIFLNYPGKKKSLSFNGGEPLLEWELVKNIYTYAEKQARKKEVLLEGVVVTNGTLLKQEHVEFFKKYKISFRISIDGDKKTHDKMRPFKIKNGKSSFEVILRNLQKIKFGSLQLSASLVFGPKTVTQLLDNIKFLQQQNFKYVDFYPEIYTTWRKEELVILKQEAKKIEQYYLQLFSVKGRKTFRLSMVDKLLGSSGSGKQAICGKIQIDAMGNFFACDKVFSLPKAVRGEYLVGNSNVGVDEKKRLQFLNNSRKELLSETGLKCETCKFKQHCACAIGHYLYKKKTASAERDFWRSFCAVSKILLTMNSNIIKRLEYDEFFVVLNRF